MKLILSFVLSICISASVAQGKGIGFYPNPFDLENYFMNLEPKKPVSNTSILAIYASSNQECTKNANELYKKQVAALNEKWNNEVPVEEAGKAVDAYRMQKAQCEMYPTYSFKEGIATGVSIAGAAVALAGIFMKTCTIVSLGGAMAVGGIATLITCGYIKNQIGFTDLKDIWNFNFNFINRTNVNNSSC
jgi:hypothetical protein